MNDRAPTSAHEQTDADPRHLVYAGVALLGFLGLSLAAVAALFYFKQAPLDRPDSGFTNGASQRTAIETDRAEMEEQIVDRLHRYRWLDRERGVVQIPIERAMEIIAEKSEVTP